MKINVGSLNPNKINAAKEIFSEYEIFTNCEVIGIEAPSEISEQPLTIDEIFTGAKNRARNAFTNCDLSIGLESGITPLQTARTGYIGICGCAIYTGQENDFYYGQGMAFEYPTEVIKKVLTNKLDLDTAFKQAGLTQENRIGYKNGIIGFLTNNKITRKNLAKDAIQMALVSFLNKDLYKKL